MIELFPQDADESSPLVVAIHGMGDRPDRWVDDWRRFPARVQIALPRAFDPHGTADRVLDVKWGREAVHAFKEQGNDAEMREYEGVGHTITSRIHDDLWSAIQEALPPST